MEEDSRTGLRIFWKEWTICKKTREIEGESNDRPEISNKEKGGGEREENTILPLGDCPNTHTH